jgi:hypothetical protein
MSSASERITQYLSVGGLFNPELMEHAKVRDLLTDCRAELDEALRRIATLEMLRPHWAQGYSSDSLAAQTATAALAQLWGLLEVDNQTDAVAAIRRLWDQADGG